MSTEQIPAEVHAYRLAFQWIRNGQTALCSSEVQQDNRLTLSTKSWSLPPRMTPRALLGSGDDRQREVDLAADAVGQIEGEPAGDTGRQRREDDFVELLLRDGLLDRDHWVGVAHGAVGGCTDLS